MKLLKALGSGNRRSGLHSWRLWNVCAVGWNRVRRSCWRSHRRGSSLAADSIVRVRGVPRMVVARAEVGWRQDRAVESSGEEGDLQVAKEPEGRAVRGVQVRGSVLGKRRTRRPASPTGSRNRKQVWRAET